MGRLWIAATIVLAGALAACGDDSSSSTVPGGGGGTGGTGAGGTGAAGTGGAGGTGAGTGGVGGSGGQGTGGNPYACNSTFTAVGTAVPAGGAPLEIALDEADGVQVVSGDSGNTRFEALYASDMPLAKSYMGPKYALLIDVLDADSDALDPKQFTALGSHGATLSVQYAEGMWHSFTLELDPANGDFVEIEEGTTPLYDIQPSPQVKAAYQLSFKSYKDMGTDMVDATGTLTGRFDGCYMRHNDESGTYQE